ncbi:hypothetical protein BLNAU_18272 [Blattamonas nauphoetae]|uniref:Uncharacterized protein n=1 Tax=Blattamonas nauphoetae TaxID=2049346 RepID=A0ABQ9X4V7_9EUKA|nr:hypothetical protein BLNAU_18272 [Blattamonas nauphoetae]
MHPSQPHPSLSNTFGTGHTTEGLMEEFQRYESEFKTGDETVQHKIAFSVFTTISSAFRQFVVNTSRTLTWELEGVLSSGIVERLCTRIETKSSELDVLPTLLVLDTFCSVLKQIISSYSQSNESDAQKDWERHFQNEVLSISNHISNVESCEQALSRIEQATLTFGRSFQNIENIENIENGEKTRKLQDMVGGMILRYFRTSIQSPSKGEIGKGGFDLAAVRREMEDKLRRIEAEIEKEKEDMEAAREAARKAEEERQREFSRKMREMEETKKLLEKWIEEGKQREEEKKREEERQREEEKQREEEERRRMSKEGAAAIEVFQQDKFTLLGNKFTRTDSGWKTLLSHSFGPHVVRMTFIIRSVGDSFFFVGLISAALTEQAKTFDNPVGNLKGGAGWVLHPSHLSAYQNEREHHSGSAYKAVVDGQRVVLEADGREGKRTLKLSQDGETQPVFFSNIPVPFRLAFQMSSDKNSVQIVSTEVFSEPSMVGGSLEVMMD